MKASSLLHSAPLYLTFGIIQILYLTHECRGDLKQYCLQDTDCINQYPSSDDTLHSCCDLDYGEDEDWTLYCWSCKYPCNADQNFCQNLITGADSSWKWVYPSNKDKGTRNRIGSPNNLTVSE